MRVLVRAVGDSVHRIRGSAHDQRAGGQEGQPAIATQTRAQVVEFPRNEAQQGSRSGAGRQLRCLCATLGNIPGTGIATPLFGFGGLDISAARWFYSPEASDHWPLGRQLKSCISISLTTSESVPR